VSPARARTALDDCFDNSVARETEIDYAGIMAGIGLKVEVTQPGKNRAYIGADTAEENGRLTIRTVTAGTPAYEQGLNNGDQIVAVDGYRASSQFMQTYIADKKPGDTIRLTLFRFDRIRDVNFVLGANLRQEYSFAPVDSPTEAQRKLYREYFKSEL